MSILVECSFCGKKYSVGDDRAGAVLPCKECGTKMKVPAGRRREKPAAPNRSQPQLPPRRRTSPGRNKRRSASGSNRGLVIAASAVGGVLLVGAIIAGVIIFARRADLPRNERVVADRNNQQLKSPQQQINDVMNDMNRSLREMQEETDRAMYGDVTRAANRHDEELGATIIISGVTDDQKRAEIYLSRKMGSLVVQIAQEEREKIKQTNEQTRKAAEQKAIGEGRLFYRYEPVRKYIGATVTRIKSDNGEYVFQVSPVRDLQDFARKTGFGNIASIDNRSRVIRIQSTLPDPAPDFDYERLKERHGPDALAAVILSNFGEINRKKLHLVERRFIGGATGDSRFIFGPKDYGDGRLLYIVGTTPDLAEFASGLDLGAVEHLENSRREITINVALPSDLPEPLPNYDLVLETPSAKLADVDIAPRTVAHTPFDRSPQPLEEHIDWAVRILLTSQSTWAIDAAVNDLAALPVDEKYLTIVSASLAKRLREVSTLRIEPLVNALIAWRTEEGVNAVLELLQDKSPHKRAIAIKALADVKTEQVAAALVSRIENEDDYMQSCISLKLLGPVAEDAVLPLLASEKPLIRGTACDLMGAVGTEKGLARLKGLVRDKDKAVSKEAKSSVALLEGRLAAAGTQTEQQEQDAAEVDRLILEIRSGDASDVSFALEQINTLDMDATRKEILITVLQAKIAEVRGGRDGELFSAVRFWQDESVISVIASAFHNKNTFIREDAVKALAEIPSPKAADLIAGRLGDFFDKDQALESLKAMGPVAEETAIRLAKNDEPNVKAFGCNILASVGTEKSLPTLKRLARDRNKNLAALAKNVLQAVENRLADSSSVAQANGDDRDSSANPAENSPSAVQNQLGGESSANSTDPTGPKVYRELPEGLVLPPGTRVRARSSRIRNDWREAVIVEVLAGGQLMRVRWQGSTNDSGRGNATVFRSNVQISEKSLSRVRQNQPKLVTADTKLQVGTRLEAQWGNLWMPATVVALNNDGTVRIHWQGYSEASDETVERSKLRYFPLDLNP